MNQGVPVGESQVVVIGGGPAGASIARLLAGRGHSVTVVSRAIDDRRGLAESLPPSTRKVLAAVGILDAVDRSGACRNIGNAVWWGQADGRIEDFTVSDGATGLQVWRPDFDRLLQAEAMSSGVVWHTANVHAVTFHPDCVETTAASQDGHTLRLRSRFVVDASGRSAILGRASRQPVADRRTHAWIGRWATDGAAGVEGDTRTLVETTDEGWVWSVPLSDRERCVTVMIDPDRSRLLRDGSVTGRYREELSRAPHIAALLDDARLQHVWGCDSSLYEAADLGGPRHLIVGDAASFIDPLSSFGVKKALTSAWMGAAVVHTCLTNPALEAAARDLFASREREAWASSVRRSVDYARQARERHDTPFWRTRAEVPPGLEAGVESDADRSAIAGAYAELRSRPSVRLRPGRPVRVAWQPAFRGDGVALEPALAADTLSRPVRFVDNVDLTRLVDLAASHTQVGALFAGYCEHEAPVPLPSFLRALSVLVAARVLEPADC